MAEGFDVWIDDRIDYGDDWELAIFEGIDTCAAFVVVMTPDSYKSKWVRRECNYAEKRDKPSFPVLLEGEEFPRYGITQYVDVTNYSLPTDSFYERLASSVPQHSTRGKDIQSQTGRTSAISLSSKDVSIENLKSPSSIGDVILSPNARNWFFFIHYSKPTVAI